MALGACSLVPDYLRPPVGLPQSWLGGEEAAVATATTWPSKDWWRGYRSPALDILIETAERNNTDIAAAAARIAQNDAQIRIAGSTLLPAVDASFDASRSFSKVGEDGGRRLDISDSVGAGLRARYEIDLFGINRANVLSAEASALFSRFDRETVGLTVVSDVATNYFQVLEFRDRLGVAQRNLENALRVLDVVESRYRNGAASALELAQQRTVVANQRATIPALESQARQSENVLATLLGTTATEVVGPSGSLLELLPPPVDPGQPSELLIRRPDIQAAEARLIGANAEIGAARAAYFPAVDLVATYSRDGANLPALFNPVSLSYSIGASLAQPIFRGGALDGGVDLARARREELIQAYRQTVINAFADVQNALVAARRSAEQESLQEEVVEQARLSFSLAEARYREGASDLLTVLDAQRTLNSAEDQLVQIRFARLEASVGLFRALGGGWRLDATGGAVSP